LLRVGLVVWGVRVAGLKPGASTVGKGYGSSRDRFRAWRSSLRGRIVQGVFAAAGGTPLLRVGLVVWAACIAALKRCVTKKLGRVEVRRFHGGKERKVGSS
jgi:hypothetical protein